MKKSIYIIVVLVVVGIAGYAYFIRKPKQNYSFRTAKIERGDIHIIVTATGSVNADTTVAVGTQVSGVMAKIFVDYNAKVRKGQVIAILDTTFLVASKEDAMASLQRSEAQLKLAKVQLERAFKLYKDSALSPSDYDQTLANYETAQAALKSSQAQLNRAVINLQYATIKAPISGVVISRNVDVGQTVIASFNTPTLFTIANNLTKMQVQANIAEADVGLVKEGQEVNFTVDAYPEDVFKGKIKQLRYQSVIVQNVVNYTVVIDVFNPELKLMSGMTANINVETKNSKSILKVPANAINFIPPAEYFTASVQIPDSVRKIWQIQSEQTKISAKQIATSHATDYLWLKTLSGIIPKVVKRGLSDGTFIEVNGDISEGDEVIIGITHATIPTDTKESKNPFMPKFPTRKKK